MADLGNTTIYKLKVTSNANIEGDLLIKGDIFVNTGKGEEGETPEPQLPRPLEVVLEGKVDKESLSTEADAQAIINSYIPS